MVTPMPLLLKAGVALGLLPGLGACKQGNKKVVSKTMMANDVHRGFVDRITTY